MCKECLLTSNATDVELRRKIPMDYVGVLAVAIAPRTVQYALLVLSEATAEEHKLHSDNIQRYS